MMVLGILEIFEVVRMMMACFLGSSSVFRRALKPLLFK